MADKFDFSGYATKCGIKCSDGRTILKHAFKDCHGKKVPLVWQHNHQDPENVLGHAVLENREDGVYAQCTFNTTATAQQAKSLVKHGDITALSIYANQLVQKGKAVVHGMIREVSLVLAGANPEACIDNLCLEHGDDFDTESEDQAIIYMGGQLKHSDDGEDELEHATDNRTIAEVFNTLDTSQKTAVYAMLAHALGGDEDIEQSDDDSDSIEHSNEGDTTMKKNVFDQTEEAKTPKLSLTHAQMREILVTAQKTGSLREAFFAHSAIADIMHDGVAGVDYGITDIDILFPDPRTLQTTPDWIKREKAWASALFTAVHKSPFSRIKTIHADITADEARARGYITGNRKIEQVFPLLKRTTTPTTVYKKQKLDRDDVVDITDFDVVAWLKAEMRVMLDEELSRAILIGDGRDVTDESKINEDNIRPIYKDDELYAHHVILNADLTPVDIMDEIVRAQRFYKGTGRPSFWTTSETVTDMLLSRDTVGRKIYPTEAEVNAAMRVTTTHEVEVMEGITRVDPVSGDTLKLIGILVNPTDYNIGADRGGQIGMFDDFDIDYNQYKYLIETRCSGALIKPKSALIIEQKVAAG